VEITKLEAFVLKRIKFGDTSLIATLFSRELGKISVLAKGARSPKSKRGLASALEPLNKIEALVYFKPSRDVQLLSAAEILDDFAAVKNDLARFEAAVEINRTVLKFLQEREPIENVWKLLDKAFARLSQIDTDKLASLLLGFKAAFLDVMGYSPVTDRCAVCGGNLTGDIRFSPGDGGLVCGNCSVSGIPLSDEETNLVGRLFGRPDDALDIEIPARNAGKLRKILERHSEYHTERKMD